MSYFLDRLNFLKPRDPEFSDGHGVTKSDDRSWENAYRARWQHDKIVRSTHGVNCTGSCSWKIYVKNGLVTWETQQTDYPRTRDDLPNRGRPSSRVTSRHLDHGRSSRVFISRSNRPYGLTCSQISGVRAA